MNLLISKIWTLSLSYLNYSLSPTQEWNLTLCKLFAPVSNIIKRIVPLSNMPTLSINFLSYLYGIKSYKMSLLSSSVISLSFYFFKNVTMKSINLKYLENFGSKPFIPGIFKPWKISYLLKQELILINTSKLISLPL